VPVVWTRRRSGSNHDPRHLVRIDDPAKAEARARELAMANARARAEALARAAGVAIKGVAAVAEVMAGGPMPPMPMRAFAWPRRGRLHSRRGGHDEVSIHVTVSYLIG